MVPHCSFVISLLWDQLTSKPYSICNLHSSLPCNPTYSQVLGVVCEHPCEIFPKKWSFSKITMTKWFKEQKGNVNVKYKYFSLEKLKWLKTQSSEGNQDGGVEGRALTPSCKNTRITTSCWKIIDRKTLELTKKDTPHPKTKEKPQWDGRRGAITAKSNPITAGCVTHRLENTYTTEVHPLEWRFWAPRQASQPGGMATEGGIPRESDFEA